MASKRMISSDVFGDEFVGELTFFERLLWIGLFAVCADDQGRVLDNSTSIRSKVFAYDKNVTDMMVEQAMSKFASLGKIIRYTAEGKHLAQLVRWWGNQTMNWAMPSKYPAPSGWMDRCRYHEGIGRAIATENWDYTGGLNSVPKRRLQSNEGKGLSSQLHSIVDSRQEDDKEEEKEDVVGNDPPVLSPLSVAFVNATHIPELMGGPTKWTDALRKMQAAGVIPADIEQAVAEMIDKKYSIAGPWSIINPAINCMSRRLRGNGNGSTSTPPQANYTW